MHHNRPLRLGTSVSPLAEPPSLKEEELVYHVLAENRAFRDFVNFSCTSGKTGTGKERDGRYPDVYYPAVKARDSNLLGCLFKHGHHFSIRLELRISPPWRPAQPKLQLQMAHTLLAMLPLPILPVQELRIRNQDVQRQTIKFIRKLDRGTRGANGLWGFTRLNLYSLPIAPHRRTSQQPRTRI
ncbi:hypothetical protein M9458_054819 [Cirrhinus mrigala]|uniref:Uncharacterized protein n=1 Tax=Cirrhinus mrigala TaxID=683832 RepID=A0ABD0MI60_CIRMR